MPRVAGAGVTWVTLRLSVIRYQHGKEQAHSACAFTHYAVPDSNEGTPWCVVGEFQGGGWCRRLCITYAVGVS